MQDLARVALLPCPFHPACSLPSGQVRVDLAGSGRRFDMEVLVTDFEGYLRGFAGRVETGEVGVGQRSGTMMG
jgi:hypothetical protein